MFHTWGMNNVYCVCYSLYCRMWSVLVDWSAIAFFRLHAFVIESAFKNPLFIDLYCFNSFKCLSLTKLLSRNKIKLRPKLTQVIRRVTSKGRMTKVSRGSPLLRVEKSKMQMLRDVETLNCMEQPTHVQGSTVLFINHPIRSNWTTN